MHPRLLVAALATAALLTSCTDDGDGGPADAATIDLEAYFGLQIGRCLEYTVRDTRQTVPDLGVVARKIENPTATHELVYRQGPNTMTDWVSLADGELRLHKRSLPDGREVLYDPPLVLLRAPLKPGGVIESKGRAVIYDDGTPGTPEEHSLRVDVLTASTETLPIGTVTGHLVTFSETPSVRPETRTFVPGTGGVTAPEGWVVVEYNFGLDGSRPAVAYKLQAVRDLGPDPSNAAVPCGAAP